MNSSKVGYFFIKWVYIIVTAVPFLGLGVPIVANAAGAYNGPALKEAKVNFEDRLSLQRGAQLYVNNCLGCHSLEYIRYERLSEDLAIPKALVEENLIFSGEQIGSQMISAMDAEHAKQWFGVVPPDLTLHARLKGPDWIYSYLTGFYQDGTRPWGFNNTYFENVGMPHVLSNMERELGEDGFSEAMHDLTNFLAYTGDPTKLARENMGRWVLAFLFILLIPAWLLNREYWKDIK